MGVFPFTFRWKGDTERRSCKQREVHYALADSHLQRVCWMQVFGMKSLSGQRVQVHSCSSCHERRTTCRWASAHAGRPQGREGAAHSAYCQIGHDPLASAAETLSQTNVDEHASRQIPMRNDGRSWSIAEYPGTDCYSQCDVIGLSTSYVPD